QTQRVHRPGTGCAVRVLHGPADSRTEPLNDSLNRQTKKDAKASFFVGEASRASAKRSECVNRTNAATAPCTCRIRLKRQSDAGSIFTLRQQRYWRPARRGAQAFP